MSNDSPSTSMGVFDDGHSERRDLVWPDIRFFKNGDDLFWFEIKYLDGHKVAKKTAHTDKYDAESRAFEEVSRRYGLPFVKEYIEWGWKLRVENKIGDRFEVCRVEAIHSRNSEALALLRNKVSGAVDWYEVNLRLPTNYRHR